MLEGFKNKTVTKQILADMFSVSTKHVQRKVKASNIKYDRATQQYFYTGTDDTFLGQDVSVIMDAPLPQTNKASTPKTKAESPAPAIQQLDIFDVLIHGTETGNNGKTQRAYYIDNEVLELLDSIKGSKIGRAHV